MKKDQPSQSLPDLELLEENTVLDWLHKNSRNLVVALGALIAFFILGTLFFSHKVNRAEEDYLNAETLSAKLQLPLLTDDDRISNTQAYEQLSQIINSRPELQAKYDGLIAQALISQGKIQEALPIAERNLQRIGKDNLPFYNDYSNATLLMAQQQYDQALKLTTQTQSHMQAQAKEATDENTPRSFGDTLYAFNTLRIAVLQQNAHNSAEANKAWESLMQSYNGQGGVVTNKRAVEAVVAHIDDTGVSLASYIEASKNK